MARGQKNYTTQEKQEALLLLEKNRGNVSKTSKEINIPRTTLKEWKTDQSVEAYLEIGDDKKAAIVAKSRQTASDAFNEMGLKHIPKLDSLIEKIIARGEVLVPQEESLKSLSMFFKAAIEASSKFAGQQEDSDSKGNITIQSYVQNIQNNYDKELG